ncbi:uncharacterized protein LOC134215666 [Armigeres subalbatus]|uniref:uncharacterized protein LOC134215666 n=1 Tax=Armigeres subalbatus TaxID=124917 RepID=UPI002ED490D2
MRFVTNPHPTAHRQHSFIQSHQLNPIAQGGRCGTRQLPVFQRLSSSTRSFKMGGVKLFSIIHPTKYHHQKKFTQSSHQSLKSSHHPDRSLKVGGMKFISNQTSSSTNKDSSIRVQPSSSIISSLQTSEKIVSHHIPPNLNNSTWSLKVGGVKLVNNLHPRHQRKLIVDSIQPDRLRDSMTSSHQQAECHHLNIG